ncbi:MAG: hypothetical protein PVF73_04015 [Bacteroidales bacterium]|jgi:hypothetical protein
MNSVRGLLFCLVIFVSLPVSSQDEEPFTLPQTLDYDQEQYYLIKMNDGTVFYARIEEMNSNTFLLRNYQGDTINIPVNAIEEIDDKRIKQRGSLGLGIGIPFGVLGANLDIRVIGYIHLSAGIGMAIEVFPVYNVGGKIYFRNEHFIWRPRFSVFYGINRIVHMQNFWGTTSKGLHGITLGLGQQLAFGTLRTIGIDLDIHYLVRDNDYSQFLKQLRSSGYTVKEKSDITLSLGIRYCF